MRLRFRYFISVYFVIMVASFQSQAQSGKSIIQMVKNSDSDLRIVLIDDDSRFKLKLNSGQKVKGKVQNFNEYYFTTVGGDTINYNDIDWIKLQRELTEFQKIAAFSALALGAWLSFGTVPAALYFVAVEANYFVILAPIATISTSVIGLRLLTGRRYHLDKWQIQPVSRQL